MTSKPKIKPYSISTQEHLAIASTCLMKWCQSQTWHNREKLAKAAQNAVGAIPVGSLVRRAGFIGNTYHVAETVNDYLLLIPVAYDPDEEEWVRIMNLNAIVAHISEVDIIDDTGTVEPKNLEEQQAQGIASLLVERQGRGEVVLEGLPQAAENKPAPLSEACKATANWLLGAKV